SPRDLFLYSGLMLVQGFALEHTCRSATELSAVAWLFRSDGQGGCICLVRRRPVRQTRLSQPQSYQSAEGTALADSTCPAVRPRNAVDRLGRDRRPQTMGGKAAAFDRAILRPRTVSRFIAAKAFRDFVATLETIGRFEHRSHEMAGGRTFNYDAALS